MQEWRRTNHICTNRLIVAGDTRTAGRVVLTDRGWDDASIERERLGAAGYELVDAQELDEDRLVTVIADADPVGLLFCWAPVTARVLAAAPRLRVATRLGVGIDNIDLAEAARRGITVTRVPDYCVDEVADHVVALVHDWARGVSRYDREVRSGQWRPGHRPLRRVRDLTVGVWGFGTIGQRTAERFIALGCHVIGDDRHADRVRAAGATPLPADDLVARADIVTLHMPAVAGAPPALDATTLATMRPGSLLVNTARGALVDIAALVDGLRAGRPGAAALDVLPHEPNVPAELLDLPVTLTPHVAFSSTASVTELRERATDDLLRVLRGEPPHDPVPPPD